jgi:hypothetical protein
MALVRPSRNKSFWGHTTDTALHTAYTCPPNCSAEIVFLHIVNAGSTNTVSAKWYVAADTYTSNFVGSKNLGTSEFVTFSPIRLFLAPGDMIQFQTTGAGHMDLVGSAVETFIPSQ